MPDYGEVPEQHSIGCRAGHLSPEFNGDRLRRVFKSPAGRSGYSQRAAPALNVEDLPAGPLSHRGTAHQEPFGSTRKATEHGSRPETDLAGEARARPGMRE